MAPLLRFLSVSCQTSPVTGVPLTASVTATEWTFSVALLSDTFAPVAAVTAIATLKASARAAPQIFRLLLVAL